ncbi:MAG: flavodoxin family protein [Coriobacteriales bacterium]|jgi:multimeric flavodoxin WrbA
MDYRDENEQEMDGAESQARAQGGPFDDPDFTWGDGTFLPLVAAEEVKPKPAGGRHLIVQKGTEELDSRVRARGESRPAPEVDTAAKTVEFRAVSAGDMPTLLFISGSPRRHTSVSLIDLIERGVQEAGVRTQRFLLCEKRVNPCIGCGACSKTGACTFAERKMPDGGRYIDDYYELTKMLDTCDGLAIVAPVYFTGPTAQLKALYDRFQPYWARKYVLGKPFPQRRPSQLFMIGTGGDPHGNEPMTTISRSALQIAGFELEKVNNFIGYKAPSDAPVEPTEEELEQMTPRQRSLIKQALVKQAEFCQRAVDAGRAFGRALRADQEPIRSSRRD